MQEIITLKDLQHAIRQLETRRKLESKELKYQFEETYESIKPANLIKNTFKEVFASNELRGNVIHSSVGLAAGMLAKTLFVGFSGSPVRKLVGTLVMFGITKLVSRRTEVITLAGKRLIKLLAGMKKHPVREQLPSGIDLPYE